MTKQILVLGVSGYDYEKGGSRKVGGDIQFLEPGARQMRSGKDSAVGYAIQKGSFTGEFPAVLSEIPGIYEAEFESKQETVTLYGRQQEVTILKLARVTKLIRPVSFDVKQG